MFIVQLRKLDNHSILGTNDILEKLFSKLAKENQIMLERIAGRVQQIALLAIGFFLLGLGLLAAGFAVHATWVPFLIAAAGLGIAWVGILVISAAR
jgi:hypothetical protein